MNNQFSKRIRLCLTACVVALLIPSVAHAEGALGLLSPTQSDIKAGTAFSFLDRGSDWDGSSMIPLGGASYANPTINQDIRIKSWRDGTNLRIIFRIDDNTRKKPDFTSLDIGDKIIIQLDPNNSGHGTVPSTTLAIGNANSINTDYRFEIVIVNELINVTATGYRLPEMAGMFITWGSLTQLIFATVAPASIGDPPGYVIDASIPLDLIGNPASDIGIAFAIINDLGNTHLVMGNNFTDVTGSEFPSSMGLDTLVNPIGLVDSEQASGSWVNPATWGVGYFTLSPSDIGFNQLPYYWLSDSLKLSLCDVTNWNNIQPPSTGINQLNLTGWYQYYPTNPCKMKVWFKTFKMGAGVVKKRFLVIWGRPGIAPKEWYVAALTPPVSITLAEEINSFIWDKVPPVAFSEHPCLRIYALPEPLNPAFDEVAINAIDTESELNMMQTTYGIIPGSDPRSAQMNFTALRTGSCPSAACLQASAPADTEPQSPSKGLLQVRYVGFNLSKETPTSIVSSSEPNVAGPPAQGQNGMFVRIIAEGIAISTSRDPRRPYVLIERLGGLQWALHRDELGEQRTLNFDVTNPLLMERDFSKRPPVDIPSPERFIAVSIKVEGPPNVLLPKVEVKQEKQVFKPGESTRAVLTVIPPGRVIPDTGPDDTKRFGLSLHAGASFPNGVLDDFFKVGPHFAFDLEYRVRNNFSLEAIFGYHRLRGDQGIVSDLNIYQLSVNAKVYAPTGSVRPFFNFGVGAYNFDPGSTDAGVNVGGGLEINITPSFAIEGAYDFHNVFTGGRNAKFSTLAGGVRFRF